MRRQDYLKYDIYNHLYQTWILSLDIESKNFLLVKTLNLDIDPGHWTFSLEFKKSTSKYNPARINIVKSPYSTFLRPLLRLLLLLILSFCVGWGMQSHFHVKPYLSLGWVGFFWQYLSLLGYSCGSCDHIPIDQIEGCLARGFHSPEGSFDQRVYLNQVQGSTTTSSFLNFVWLIARLGWCSPGKPKTALHRGLIPTAKGPSASDHLT